tara:strand:+ start:269 stop:757 length:489 start_codon:yes stop_codon:yes gene_type:complete
MTHKKTAIQQYQKTNKNYNLIKNLRTELEIIDKEIFTVMSGLFEAQKVQIKSTLSQGNNWLTKLQKEWVLSAASKSAGWHKQKLSLLIQQRKKLQVNLDKLTGDYWPKQIRKFLLIIGISVLIIIFITFTMMSLMMAIYFIPIWIVMIITYLVIKKNLVPRR